MDLVCRICLSEIDQNSVTTTCGHCYHKDCIAEWINRKSEHNLNLCPICRAKITINDLRPLYLHVSDETQKKRQDFIDLDTDTILTAISKKINQSNIRRQELEQEIARLKRILTIYQSQNSAGKIAFNFEEPFTVFTKSRVFRIAVNSDATTLYSSSSGLLKICTPFDYPVESLLFKFRFPISCLFFINSETVFLGSDQAILLRLPQENKSSAVIASGILPHKSSVFTCGVHVSPPFSRCVILLGDSHGVVQLLSASTFSRGGFYSPHPSPCVKMIQLGLYIFVIYLNGAVFLINFDYSEDADPFAPSTEIILPSASHIRPQSRVEVLDAVESNGIIYLLAKKLEFKEETRKIILEINVQEAIRGNLKIVSETDTILPEESTLLVALNSQLFTAADKNLINVATKVSTQFPDDITSLQSYKSSHLIVGTQEGHVFISHEALQ